MACATAQFCDSIISRRRLTVKANIFLGAVLLCPAALWAADQPFDIKPGLWEVASTTQMSGMPPIPNLDKMTPEQRARIEGMMKNMAGTPQTNTTKSCVTREGIDKAIAQASSNRNNSCAPKLVSATASKVVLHIDCSREKAEVKSNGDITIERQDSEHFTGNGAMKMTGANGHSMDMKWSMTGRFLSSNCGDVKPAK
jgi:hypothetical protein